MQFTLSFIALAALALVATVEARPTGMVSASLLDCQACHFFFVLTRAYIIVFSGRFEEGFGWTERW